ncbi:UxaA family hydrolase [Calycomorphotria hydatis]|uniref:Altronate dehydratase n=1 Tax=Calycomorphotria hydatis TaxID=2528027 RepID=A0A517TB59_9PLAN|nr:altronate dehydratase [Calycomorphotria hydatis]QDT65609.1 Altronate dehydratase [Calycomorphotria hydatis]
MTFISVHPSDDMWVALRDYNAGEIATNLDHSLKLLDNVTAKHKIASRTIETGELVRMYNMVVGKATETIPAGRLLTRENLVHATADESLESTASSWNAPDVSRWNDLEFQGYHRSDGKVGTRNHWIVIPMVFCENRNLQTMRDAMLEELGYAKHSRYRAFTKRLLNSIEHSGSTNSLLNLDLAEELAQADQESGYGINRRFANVDGIQFLTHEGGCGGAYSDAETLCGLFAGYINNPNVAGATVLALGCEKSQVATLEAELHKRNPNFDKPLYILKQQEMGSEETIISNAIRQTLVGLVKANDIQRKPAPLSELTVGLECGGSDGFSGLSANPAVGHCSDLLVSLGAATVLSEFPELAGCESELAARCAAPETANRFRQLMLSYEERCLAEGNGFAANPSPGNIRDGLITDAMKSAGAAKKAGSSPIIDVLDYPEPITKRGLNLLCTPGNDVESTTAKAGSGATMMLFTTGLGTPTGNAVTPVIKISSNSELASRMPDIIDVDTGGIIKNTETIEQAGERLLEQVIASASGQKTKAEILGQNDFIPWRRGLTF